MRHFKTPTRACVVMLAETAHCAGQGVNVEATLRLAQAVSIPIIASGGISTLDDVRSLCTVQNEGIMGAIIGRALYDGALDLKEAQRLVDAAVEGD